MVRKHLAAINDSSSLESPKTARQESSASYPQHNCLGGDRPQKVDSFGAISFHWATCKVTFRYSRQFREWQIHVEIRDPEYKSSDAIQALVDEQGLLWNSYDRAWSLKSRGRRQQVNHGIAQETFAHVVNILEAEYGPATGPV